MRLAENIKDIGRTKELLRFACIIEHQVAEFTSMITILLTKP